MLEPLQLPSGKIIDFARFVALLPTVDPAVTELVLDGASQPLGLDQNDVEAIQCKIQKPKFTKVGSKVYVPRYERMLRLAPTPEQQEQYAVEVADRLTRLRILSEQLAARPEAEQEFESFKEIIDRERPSGQKVYSLE